MSFEKNSVKPWRNHFHSKSENLPTDKRRSCGSEIIDTVYFKNITFQPNSTYKPNNRKITYVFGLKFEIEYWYEMWEERNKNKVIIGTRNQLITSKKSGRRHVNTISSSSSSTTSPKFTLSLKFEINYERNKK